MGSCFGMKCIALCSWILAMFVTVIRKQIRYPSSKLNERLVSVLIDLSALLQCSLCTLKLSRNYCVISWKVLFIYLFCLYFCVCILRRSKQWFLFIYYAIAGNIVDNVFNLLSSPRDWDMTGNQRDVAGLFLIFIEVCHAYVRGALSNVICPSVCPMA